MNAPHNTRAGSEALVFSHANGFPAGVYGRLFEALGPGFSVSAVERFGHDPRWPVARRWDGLRDQLLAHVEQLPDASRPWLVGHSLGGYLSVLAAAELGERVAGVVLLDSPLIAGPAALLVRWGRRLGLDRHLMPIRQTAQRRRTWSDLDAVQAHFAAKPAFAVWDEAVLRDYARHGTRASTGGRTLHFEPEVELSIYRSLPTRTVVDAAKACRAPVAFIGGTRSREVRQVGLRTTRRLTGGRVQRVEGGHLFPMERPLDTAAAIRSAIQGMRDTGTGSVAAG